jgi:hypothetical protein
MHAGTPPALAQLERPCPTTWEWFCARAFAVLGHCASHGRPHCGFGGGERNEGVGVFNAVGDAEERFPHSDVTHQPASFENRFHTVREAHPTSHASRAGCS